MVNFDFFDPDGQRAVVYTQSARQGRRIELGLQVYNHRTKGYHKVLFTQLLKDDLDGISFELARLFDKAYKAGFKCVTYQNEAKHVGAEVA